MHPGAPATPILVAWGITTEGKPVLVGLAAAAAESSHAWDSFLDELADRGLRSPLLVISDGAAGLILDCRASQRQSELNSERYPLHPSTSGCRRA
jgi:transposase-like protein